MVESRQCGVLGDPIEHSLSPVLHRAAFTELGLDWGYAAHRVDEPALPAFIDGLDASWRGLSLTMPLKRAVLPLATQVSELAQLVGAANTLVLTRVDDGSAQRAADNTDVGGAQAALRAAGLETVTAATIRGGGATAASTLVALAGLGARTVQLAVRSPERAAETLAVAARLGSRVDVQCVPLDATAIGEVVVSTIPAAAQDDRLVAADTGADLVFDVIYDPWPTPVAAAAAERGQPVVSGLDLLVHQAALQCTAFTGMPAPFAAMMAAGRAALADRSAGGSTGGEPR